MVIERSHTTFSYKNAKEPKKKNPFSIFQELQHELSCYRLKKGGGCVQGEDICPETLERKIEK